jgi:hypothetical protein
MEIRKPVWQLKKRCPHCNQGELVFITCPGCKKIMLQCSELGTIFTDPRDLSSNQEMTNKPNSPCPACDEPNLDSFPASTTDEIVTSGFTADEYE